VPSARLGPLLRALALVAGVAVPAAAPPPAGAADTVELVIRRDAGLTAAERSALRDDAGVRFERRVRLADAEVVTVPAADAEQALRDLRADPDVRWAQRDDGVSAQAVRTDPGFGYLWGLDNTGQTILGVAGDADADMDVPEAWTRSTGAGQTIAVVDTGADAAHADLAGQLATNAGEMGGKETNGLDDDADGLVDNWRGYDFAYGDATPSDIDGHGSHVAGTIAAANGNGLGVTGVAPDARVLVLKALDDAGSGQWSDVANAFDYAGDIGVRVVNASLGGAGEVPVVSDVIAQHPNTLYVVAAGNTATNLDNQTYSPCEAPHANVLCVGASDSTDRRASFSSFSPTAVDVFAPGVDVLSTTGGSYAFMSGTSMAAPHVAALAALILAHRPGLTAAQVKQAIMVSSERRAALALFGADGGRANANAALSAAEHPEDGDGDSVPDVIDNCAAAANRNQADFDRDGTGDACDPTPRGPDTDGDTVADVDDNCAAVANPGQQDADADQVGDACDPTPRGPDLDGDDVAALDDACPDRPGPAAHRGCPAPAPVVSAVPAPAPAVLAPPAPAVLAPPAPAAAPAPLPASAGATTAPAPTTAAPPVLRSVTATTTGSARCRAGACTRLMTFRVSAAGAAALRLTVENRTCRRGRCAYRRVASSSSRRVRLAPGRYRVTVTATGPGGRSRKTIAVTVPRR
jgi:subtilisin family serine protease